LAVAGVQARTPKKLGIPALLKLLQQTGRAVLEALRAVLDRGFGPDLNPLNYLGALTIYFCWIVLVSGVWLFMFFKTSVAGAYESVEYLTHDQWYLGGLMRSLHRYASDAAIVTLALHMIKEFCYDRYRGMRWYSWFTGVPLLWLLIPLGITGYWLVWDQLAWYVALTSAELLDWLPIFSESMARNFLSSDVLSDRFFTLMAFMHLIGLPLFLVFGIWIHVLRINGPRINPPRALMAVSLIAMIGLSFIYPALSQGEVDMTQVPESLGLDWFYLLVYPLMKHWSPAWVWGLLTGVSLLLCMLPWIPPQKARSIAEVDLENCNGCARCADDCPFGAITMERRSDGKAYESEAVVDPAVCLSCGICVGSCPTATPFRRHSALLPGIDIPDLTAAVLRERLLAAAEHLQGSQRVIVFACQDNAKTAKLKSQLNDPQTAILDIICAAQLPPAFLDFILSRDLADGVVVAGCAGGNCQYRFGAQWTEQRIARQRDPQLRKRVDADRVALAWQDSWSGFGGTSAVVSALRETLPGPEETESATDRPPSHRNPWKIPVTAIALVLFVSLLGALSAWPRLSLIEKDQAMVSVSLSHAGQRIGECRKLTQEELNKLPPNMRKLDECPRERLPVKIYFTSNGNSLYEAILAPSGFWNDGESSVYRRLSVSAGPHRLFIGMIDSERSEGFDYSLEAEVDLAPGQHLVVNFDSTLQEFVFKQE
jgi:quinol-cytochrome oxidoreductase complex cytochrome b subunit/coenzyme F420-reducing hydrogenase delta subunit